MPLPTDSAGIQALNTRMAAMDASARLQWAWETFGVKAAFGTSFQGAGLVAIDLALQAGAKLPVFTLDTGLLFPETYALKAKLEAHWGIVIESLLPDLTVEQQHEALGPELWKTDPDLCCNTRKVVPLRAKLQSLDCWITGVRREQSAVRADTGILEYVEDETNPEHSLWKLNPVADWSRAAIWDYIKAHGLPYNPLQDQGYRSIGCTHCTRPTAEGQDERAGRWTGFNKTECGLHTAFRKKA
jgi:phosphoadenosine phosphosulfate reductase